MKGDAVESATTSPARSMSAHADRRRRQTPLPRKALPRQLDSSDLITLVGELPSREGMRPPRSDYADNLIRFHNALWRHAHALQTACYRMTWDQLRAAAGYEPVSYASRLTSLENYAAALQETGVLTITGIGDLADGRACVVTLKEPPDAAAILTEAAERGERCEARRRRETRSQRRAWRVAPYVAKGGRGRAVERWDFRWGTYVGSQGSSFSKEKEEPLKPCVGARRSLVDASAPPASGADPGGAGGIPPTRSAAPDWAPSPRNRGAVLERLRTASTEGGVVELRAAALAGADPVSVGIVGYELLFPERPLRMSRKRREQLRRSALVIDRVHGERGAGAVHLLALMEQRAAEIEVFLQNPPKPPESIAYFVVRLRADACDWRKSWRERRRERRTPVEPANRVDDLPWRDPVEIDDGGPL